MGYQLWTSPTTGYRRKGTRLTDLRYAVGAGIITQTILEPLQCCPLDGPSNEMKRILEARGFDVAGVQPDRNGRVLGFVSATDLTNGSVRDHMKPLSADCLISDATPLGGLLRVLHDREHVFVLRGSDVGAIVTRADLNKPPVRVYLFGLISLLEMHMQFWVRWVYGHESWKEVLPADRLTAAEAIQTERRARNEEITLVDCLQFCDERDLILASDKLRNRLGLSSKRKASRMLRHAEELRNRLAHSQQDLVQGSNWKDQIELISEVEEFVHRSDDTVEQEAKASRTSTDELWVAVRKE